MLNKTYLMKNNRTMVLSFSKYEFGKNTRISMNNSGIILAMPPDADKAKFFMQESFGWGSDDNKYYPDLNVQKDLRPKEEDFVNAPFRMLSATIVAAGTWRSTDFTNIAVLKDSVGKLKDKPVFKEHDTSLDNWVGLVRAPKFSPAFTMEDGTKIPAGIDAIISIDGKTNPKIARGVLSGGIFSNSVTVEFDWEPSHTFVGDNAEYEFERNVGNVIDGKMVCRKVTNIINYYESSLVWLGADPYAKQITDTGDLIHVDESSAYEDEVVQTSYKNESKYSMSLGVSKNLISLSKNSFKNNNPKNTNIMTLEQVLAALRKSLKLADDAVVTEEQIATLSVPTEVDTTELASAVTELTGEKIEGKHDVKVLVSKLSGFKGIKVEKLTALEATETQVVTLTSEKAVLSGEIGTLKADKATLTAKIDELTPKAIVADKFIADKKVECTRLYTLSMDNNPVQAVLSIIEKASNEELDGLLKQYTKEDAAKFSGKCQDCGSANFEFKSSVGGEADTNEFVADPTEGVKFADLHKKFSQPAK